MRRVVFTAATGKPVYARMALGLARSLELAGDDTPRAVVTDQPTAELRRWFSLVLAPTRDQPYPYLDKLTVLQRCDADAAIVLDSDCLALKPLDAAWSVCSGHGVALQGWQETEGTFYGRPIPELLRAYGVRTWPKFTGGFLYLEAGDASRRVVERSFELAADYDRLGFARFRGQVPDEACLAVALVQTGLGHLFQKPCVMHSGLGALSVPKLDVLRGRCRFFARGRTLTRVEPIVFHAHYYRQFFMYWRELRRLERLDRYDGRP